MHTYLCKKMDDRIVSTAVLTLSRQQEEFLSRYRTHEAQKAYFESYGLGVTPFFRGGGGSHGIIPPAPEPVLPYDYEVEFLEVNANSGIAFIDTLVVPSGPDISTKCGFTLLGYPAESFCRWFFAWSDDSRCSYRIVRDFNFNTSVQVFYNSRTYVNIPVSIGSFFEIEFTDSGKVFVNNVEYSLPPQGTPDNIASMKLFGDISTRLTYGRMHYFSMSKNNILLVDMIPVSKDGIGYMYDKVSGKLFAAQGGGSFVVGPRKI